MSTVGVDRLRTKMMLIWLSVSVFSTGCLLDHFTTAYGLTIQGISESNSLVIFLMDRGVWHLSELFVISFGVFSALFSLRAKSDSTMRICVLLLAVGGLLRLTVGLQNLTIIFNAIA